MAERIRSRGTPAPAPKRSGKQAVVVIHGMGEQRPMETLRSFVEAVWETDLSLTAETSKKRKVRTGEGANARNKSWIVPDTRTGSLELSRITTPQSDFGARTDFFEFYWADIMQGTTFDHVKAWAKGLLFRWPHQVPRDVWSAWIVMWVLVVAAVGLAVHGVVGVGGTVLGAQLSEGPAWSMQFGLILCIVGALAGAAALIARLRREPKAPLVSWAFAILVPIAVAAAAWVWMPWPKVVSWDVASLALSAAIGYFVNAFLVPYFGDVARYVRTAPDTVGKRAEVRERGLALLRRLHGVEQTPGVGAKDYDFGTEKPYDRIIVVAHSLGTVIAFDLISHLWAELGPTSNNPAEKSMKALRAVDNYVRKTCPLPPKEAKQAFDLAEYRTLQRQASRALCEEDSSWRITDFVTLGSPLTHAEFLIAHDRPGFERLIEDRLVSVAPPAPDGSVRSFLYKPEGDNRSYAHHAAVFSATRWTNIYDPHTLATGDIVSGPARENFGSGVEDHGVRIRRTFLGIPGRASSRTHATGRSTHSATRRTP